MTISESTIQNAYIISKERYLALGVDVDQAIARLEKIAVSLHCWQGDDIGGFENPHVEIGGGLAVTGNYPGKASTAGELRQDLDKAFSLIPGKHRLNLHAIYLEANKKVARNKIAPEYFSGWVDWAKEMDHGIDFNPTCFSHPLAEDGFTLSHPDAGIRQFWIEHCIVSREIGAYFGEMLGTPAVTNIWIPDGYKDSPVDRQGPRTRLLESLDKIFENEIDPTLNLDAVECKLFGIGSETYVVGSHEFYMGYAVSRGKLLCLDAGHFHPTEVISDKISAVMQYVPGLLLHVSRGVRWDSDHVVTLTDELQAIMQELVRGEYLDRTHIGLDFFDASINRVAAWVIGTHNALRAMLMALLEPTTHLRELELSGDFTARLALFEEMKCMPFGSIWDYHCLRQGVPVGISYLDSIRKYEKQVLAQRG